MYGGVKVGLLGVGADLNSIIETGFYDVRSATNGPVSATDYIVSVYKGPLSSPGDVEVIQVAYDKTTGVTSTRALNGGAWSSWTTAGAAYTDTQARNAIKTKTQIAAINAVATADATVGTDGTTAAQLANSLKTTLNALIAALKA